MESRLNLSAASTVERPCYLPFSVYHYLILDSHKSISNLYFGELTSESVHVWQGHSGSDGRWTQSPSGWVLVAILSRLTVLENDFDGTR